MIGWNARPIPDSWQGGGEVTFTNCNIYQNYAEYVRAPQYLSIATMDTLERSTCMHVLICWQGGGVHIDGGEVTFTNCNIYENTADYVRAP